MSVPKHNRESTLPINIRFDLIDVEEKPNLEPFDKEMSDALFSTGISLREKVHQTVVENICYTQVK